MKSESSNVVNSIKDNPVMAGLIFVLVLLIGFIVFGLVQIDRNSRADQGYLQTLADLRAQSYRITSLSQDASSAQEEAFDQLAQVIGTMTGDWNTVSSSPWASDPGLATDISQFNQVWQQIRSNAQVIVDNRDTILFLDDVATRLNQSLPELQAEHTNIVEILLENEAPGEQVARAQEQSWRAERIGRNVDKMMRGGGDVTEAADEFNLDANLFGKMLQGMQEGDLTMGVAPITDPDAVTSLGEISDLFEFVSSSVSEIFESSPALFSARQSADLVLDQTPLLLEAISDLSGDVRSLGDTRPFNELTIVILAGLAALCLVAITAQLLTATRRRLAVTADTNERNQNAILRLLDELADLADGDLTTTATVTEDFTGAIADSINYTIDQLRVLVSRINETSSGVASASQDTQQTALHLAEAAEHQAQEIAGASAAVNEMAVTIDQVSANAAESASVAERAVSIANNGAKVVQNTIHGMDTIREQIQDTSKRIKRLGESSQEIGDIVSLINDIADQTNILALNAAIQASMAGDAGRGFAVVADEVQRLAERSAAATKQIEALVKTIQNDTNEAVISMEQTTAEVVRGARLAQDAGVALEEIENVSTSLADLIQNISNAARQQASSAGHISNTMNVIQEITSQTASGTGATANSVGNLASMAMELRESVAGFTLPESAVSSTATTGSFQAIEEDALPLITDEVDATEPESKDFEEFTVDEIEEATETFSEEEFDEQAFVETLEDTVDIDSEDEFNTDLDFDSDADVFEVDVDGDDNDKKTGTVI